jgi:antitoxin YefM
MPVETTYTQLRQELATYLDRVTADQEVVVVRRRNAPDVAIVSASELAGLMETAHLLRSPRNARRLMAALNRAKASTGKPSTPSTLRRKLNLETAG